MNEWWELLTGLEKFYWVSALSGTGIFLIQMFLTFTGLHHDTDLMIDDVGHAGMTNANPRDDFQLLTIRNIIIFFAIFGWVGLFTLYEGFGWLESIIAGSIAGVGMMYAVATMLKKILGLAIDKTVRTKDALNQEGEVYLPIPAKETGVGKVLVTVKGVLKELDAKSIDKELKSGTKIRVIDILEGNVLLVDEIEEDVEE